MRQQRLLVHSRPATSYFVLWLSRPRSLSINYAHRSSSDGCCPTSDRCQCRLPATSNNLASYGAVDYEIGPYDRFAEQDRYHFQRRLENKIKLQTNQIVHEGIYLQKFTHHSHFSITKIQHRCRLLISMQYPHPSKKTKYLTKNDHHPQLWCQQTWNQHRLTPRWSCWR